jgi:hypothetical protein
MEDICIKFSLNFGFLRNDLLWWEKFLLTRIAKLKIKDNYKRTLRSQEVEENCIMRSFITCTLLQV